MSEIEAVLQTIQQRMPDLRFIADADALSEHAVDDVVPRLVVTPATTAEVAQIVALAQQHHLTLLARGGGSRIHLGELPQRIDILLETIRLNRVIEHEAADLTCHIEAGITLAAAQAQFAKKGQKLSLDPPHAETATLGGLLASNASGPKRLRYGTARDLVIGLTVVQADGAIAHSGGRVVKNVAGYDLNKLYIGSLGTLGIIVEAHCKLHPLQEERTLLLTYAQAADAMQTVDAILHSPLTPDALELIDPRAASDFATHLPTNAYTLVVNVEGSSRSLRRQLDEIGSLAKPYGAEVAGDLADEEQTRFWHDVRNHMQGTLICKVSLLVSQVTAYLQHIEQVCQQHNLAAATIAHAGNGVLYVELQPADATLRLIDAITTLRRRAQEVYGSLVVERCPVDLKRHISVWGNTRGDFYMMQRLKQQFDPHGTFVSGRFYGGL